MQPPGNVGTAATPSLRPTPRPQALLRIRRGALAVVCAWCADKAEADTWCRTQGLEATHTICPACLIRFQ